MNPYAPYNPYNQGYVGSTPPPPVQESVVHHYHHGNNGNQTAQPPVSEGRTRRMRSKFSHMTQTVVPSVIGCIFLQAVAYFFVSASNFTFRQVINEVDGFSDDKSHDTYVLSVVFNVFFALAAALTAPMIMNSGYSTVILSGSVLFIFSTMSSSLVSTAKILTLPYGIFGACAYGMLRVGSQVAMLDYLNNRRPLAASLTFLGASVGQVAAMMCFIFTDMEDDARYDKNGQTRWQNNLRIIEVTAVVAFMSAAVLRKPSHATGSWPEVFQYKPFYVLTISYGLVQIGFSFFNEIAGSATDELNISEKYFDVHPIFTPFFIYLLANVGGVLILIVFVAFCCADGIQKSACLVGGVAAILLAAASFAHKEAYDELWQLACYTGGAGLMSAFIQVTTPLAMIYFTGRDNYKIALPFLEFAGAVGGLVAYLIQVEKPSDMTFSDTWYLTGALFAAFGIGALWCHCNYPSWSRHQAGEDEHEFEELEAIENEAFELDGDDTFG